MHKLKLIVSDFHMGAGRFLPGDRYNYLEDFVYDDKFIEFLNYHRNGPFAEADVELIINGDFFNMLHIDPEDSNPDFIDEKVSVGRIERILSGHPALFEALRNFSGTMGHHLTFILGNHDPGLLFAAVQGRLKAALGEAIQFIMGAYRFDGVHVEHGNQYFADNAYNPRRFFLTKDLPAPLVNLPWGSFFVIHFLSRMKKERPYFDKVYPFKYYLRWALIHDTVFALRAIARILFYFFWIRFRRDPHRRSSFVRTLQILKEVPLSPRLDREAKRILLSERKTHVVVFGHTHHALIRQFAPDKTYINTGLWNEQISLEVADLGKLVRFTYAQLDYTESGPIRPSLKEWKGSYKMVEEVT